MKLSASVAVLLAASLLASVPAAGQLRARRTS